MPVTFTDSEIKRSEGLWKGMPEDIDLLPELNGRHDLPNIEWLITSILTVGQIQPVTIRKTGGRPVLTSGYSRWRAVQEINKRKLTPEPLRLVCSYSQYTDKQAFIVTIHENIVRNATTPMDDAYNIQKLINVFQMPMDEIAETYRASMAWVKDRLTLLEVAPEVETAIREGRIKPTAAVAIAKLGRAVQKAVVAKPGPVTAKDIKNAAPIPERKAVSSVLSLKQAISVMLAECDQQPDVMVYEIHRDTIIAIRASLK